MDGSEAWETVAAGVSRTRDRRSRLVALARRDVPTEAIRSVEELQALVRDLPAHTPEVRVEVDSLDLVRVLTVAGPELTVDRLVVRVRDWERPTARWNGQLGRVDHLLSATTSYPEEEPGTAEVDVRLSEPTPLASVARAVYPVLGVDRSHHGYGYAELATADVAPAALALLPTRTAPGIPELPSRYLEGVGLSRADLGLVGSPRVLEELRSTADDPHLTLVQHPLLVDATGHLSLTERLDRPIIDLSLHHPVGRLHTFDLPPGSFALTVRDGDLTFTPRDLDPDPEVEDLVGWSRPVTAPLGGAEVRRLRPVESIDLSGLRPGSATDETVLCRRLAELAATGVVLHSLPLSFGRADDLLGARLAELLRSPYRPTKGLVRELRSVPQRREAMQRFGGFFELAGHAATLGHRLLPTVSAVLSSMRPSRVSEVLRALAAQHYPHLEIAVALHGVEGPLDPEFEEAARLSGAQVLRYDASTPFGSVLADTARRTSGDLVVKIDDDDFYGPHVIGDLVLAYLYSGADVVGKTTEYLYFEEIDHTAHRMFQTERYHYQVAGGAMLLSRGALNDIGGWRPTPHSTDRSVLIRVGNAGGIGYRTQSLGYVYVRHSDGHTWKQADSLLMRNAPEQWPRFMPEIVSS